MSISAKIQQSLEQVLSGQPWYGRPIYEIMDDITFDAAYEKPSRGAHNIAEILLHMLSWTEEVMDRLNGMTAGLPSSGNWPDPGQPDEEKYKLWIDDFKLANVNLLKTIGEFPEKQWQELIDDQRKSEPITTYEELMAGFIQHQVYHVGQIAILVKIING